MFHALDRELHRLDSGKQMSSFAGESTFWYYVARQTEQRVASQILESIETMTRRAAELELPIRWRPERSVPWATACRLYVISKQRIDAQSEFRAFRNGASAIFQPRTFLDDAFTRIVGNVSGPAFSGRSPTDSIADSFAMAALEYRVPDSMAEVIHADVLTHVVTDEVMHAAALLAVAPERELWEGYIRDYRARRPSWFRRTFSNADVWLFGSGETASSLPPEERHTAEPPTYPRPDRSDHVPNFTKADDRDYLDIGWNEGTLSDGRPFRLECWAEDQVTMLTYFMSTRGLEEVDAEFFQALLEREGLIRFRSDRKYVSSATLFDPSGHEMWSVNVVVGDDDDTFVDDLLPLRNYERQPRGLDA